MFKKKKTDLNEIREKPFLFAPKQSSCLVCVECCSVLKRSKLFRKCVGDDLCDCLIMRQVDTDIECGDFGRYDGDEEEDVGFIWFLVSEFNPGLEGVLTAGCPCATAASKSKPYQAPSKAPT